MADTERLMNKAQGDDIISALGTIAANILQVPSEKLIIDWSYTTLPTSGNDHTIYAIPTGDADDPWDFYVWNDVDEEWVQFDWNFAVDSALSTTSENPVQNKVVKGALDDKVDKVEGKGLSSNDFTDEDKAALDNMELDIESTQSVSGNPLTLTDCAPINAESLVVELEPIQEGSGDPSPTNIRPITGYTECEVESVGINFLENNVEDGSTSDYTVTVNPDGTLNVTGTAASGKIIIGNFAMGFYGSGTDQRDYKKHLPNGSYKFLNSGVTGLNAQVVGYNDDGVLTVIATGTNFTIDDTYKYNHVRLYATAGSYSNAKVYPMIYSADISSPTYEPYTHKSVTVQFGQTVYGGRSNFTEGGTDDAFENVDLGDLTWTMSSTAGRFYASIPNTYADYKWVNDLIFYCSCYKPDGYGDYRGYYGENGTIRYYYYLQGNVAHELYIHDDRYSDATAFKAAVTGQTICYEKATADVIATPPTDLKLLQGTNHITTNGTTINLGYQPDNVIGDVKGEIEKCAVDAEYMQFTDGTDTFTDVNLSLDALSHTVSVVGSKIEQKRFICFEVMDKMGGVLQGILASCIAFADGAKTPSGTAFRAYIDPVSMYVDLRICGSGGSYMLSYQSETSFSASAFYVRVRMMNNL